MGDWLLVQELFAAPDRHRSPTSSRRSARGQSSGGGRCAALECREHLRACALELGAFAARNRVATSVAQCGARIALDAADEDLEVEMWPSRQPGRPHVRYCLADADARTGVDS